MPKSSGDMDSRTRIRSFACRNGQHDGVFFPLHTRRRCTQGDLASVASKVFSRVLEMVLQSLELHTHLLAEFDKSLNFLQV